MENRIEFRKIEKYDNYLFGSDGSVISLLGNKKRVVNGSPDKDGYLKITITLKNGKPKYVRKHRLIAEAFYGYSDKEVNHIDSNKKNNSIENLEYVSLAENQCHRRKRDGYNVGVCWDKKSKKWRAYIQFNKKWEHLGFYDNKEDAKIAYNNRSLELKITNKYANPTN